MKHILFPFVGRGHPAHWALHGALVAALLCGLWVVNGLLDLHTILHSSCPALHEVWLPLLFVLVYLVSYLGYWLWSLLGLGQAHTAYPDLDAAWSEAVRALQQAGIGVDEVPLFLVLGRPASTEAGLIEACAMPLVVQQTPARADAPLHVFASRDAIFVTCPEASLLSRQATLFAARGAGARPEPAPLAPMHAILARAQAQGRGPGELTDEEKHEIGRLVAPERDVAAPAPSATPLLTDPAEMELWTDRLQHVCRLIDGTRRPFCPVNGLVLLIPWNGLTGDVLAGHVARLTRLDLDTARQALQIECPCILLVCDLERVPGFRMFVEQLSEPERARPLGQQFPLVPDVDPHEIKGVLQNSIQRLQQHALPKAILSGFDLDPAVDKPGQLPTPLRGNIHLYQLFSRLRAGCQRLERVVLSATRNEGDTPSMLAGCYLAATGSAGRREQAFVAGVFQELLKNQNFVAWSPEALAEEAGYRKLVRLGYVGLVGLLAVVALVGFFPL